MLFRGKDNVLNATEFWNLPRTYPPNGAMTDLLLPLKWSHVAVGLRGTIGHGARRQITVVTQMTSVILFYYSSLMSL